MNDLINKIRQAQVIAGENAVIKDLQIKELIPKKEKPEYILCSAVWANDGKSYEHQPKNILKGFVICGRRHHNCLITAFILNGEKNLTSKINEANGKIIQGFLTNLDKFVDRKEAGKLAFEATQISDKTDCLMSEDLY